MLCLCIGNQPLVSPLSQRHGEWKIWEGRSADSLVKKPCHCIDRTYKTPEEPCLPHCCIHLQVYKCVRHWSTRIYTKKKQLQRECICSAGQTICSANKWLDCNVPWPSPILLSVAPYIYCRPSSYITLANGALHTVPSCPLLKRLRGHLSPLHWTDRPGLFLTKPEGRGDMARQGKTLQWIIMFHNTPRTEDHHTHTHTHTHTDQHQIIINGEQGSTGESCFSFSTTRGSICPSTSFSPLCSLL